MEIVDELARQALQVRLRELRHFERAERGLARAYRAAHGLPGIPDRQLAELAEKHIAHAELLRARLQELGGAIDREEEDVWVIGQDVAALRWGEQQSLATYHDHLTDMDRASAEVVNRFILPEHADALSLLDPHYERDRDGDL
jgi:hypothetical protein